MQRVEYAFHFKKHIDKVDHMCLVGTEGASREF